MRPTPQTRFDQREGVLLKEKTKQKDTPKRDKDKDEHPFILGGNLGVYYITHCPFLKGLKDQATAQCERALSREPRHLAFPFPLPLATCDALPKSGPSRGLAVPICAMRGLSSLYALWIYPP